MIRVFVIARSAVVRAGLEALLRARHEVAGSAATIEDPPEADVLLIDLEPGTEDSGISAPAVLLIDRAYVSSVAGSAGIHPRALLTRDATEAEILAAVEAVAAGLTAVHPELLDALAPARAVTMRDVDSSADPALSPREVEVLRMLAEGLPNKIIAYRLGISEHTVKFHLTSLFSKLNVGSRTEAVTVGIRQGLVLL
ncbi:MAG: LuxR C-terminal-related transcriptional regulator [Bryobacteraceae bacterium]